MKVTFVKDAKLKSGKQIPTGTEAEVIPHPDPTKYLYYMLVTLPDGTNFKTKMINFPQIFTGGGLPSMDELEEWLNDGVAESVAGYSVEPDGYDQHGFPSWFIVLGMI